MHLEIPLRRLKRHNSSSTSASPGSARRRSGIMELLSRCVPSRKSKPWSLDLRSSRGFVTFVVSYAIFVVSCEGHGSVMALQVRI